MKNSEKLLNGAFGKNFTFNTDTFGTRDDRTVISVRRLEYLTQLAGVSHIRFVHGEGAFSHRPFYNLLVKEEPTKGTPRKWRRAEVTINSRLINQLSEATLHPGKDYSANINAVLKGSLKDISKKVNFDSGTMYQAAMDISSLLGAYIMGNIDSMVSDNDQPAFIQTLKYRLILSTFFNVYNLLSKSHETWGSGVPYQLLHSVRPERHLLLNLLLVKPLTRPKNDF